jgi:hypothetical protein
MEEPLISFETAKLAKEKGFKETFGIFYTNEGELKEVDRCYCHTEDYYCSCGFEEAVEECKKSIQASSQSLLQKWLRETHNIEFVIKPFYDSSLHKTTYVADPINILNGKTARISRQCSYEEALEEGLKLALNLINR